METNKLPPEYVHVMITYVGQVRVRDKYYDHYETQTVTRRAFYSKSEGYYNGQDQWVPTPNGYFCVPAKWSTWYFSDGSSALLPDSFRAYPRVLPEEVIKWEVDKTKI